MGTNLTVDLDRVIAALANAKARADALPYEVEFEVDAENGLMIVRGTKVLNGGMWRHGSTTGRTLTELMTEPEAAVDYVFGFLEASFRAD